MTRKLGVGPTLGDLLSGMARELLRGPGPERWCKRCHRKHPSRSACQLVSVGVTLPSGKLVERKVHASRVPRP